MPDLESLKIKENQQRRDVELLLYTIGEETDATKLNELEEQIIEAQKSLQKTETARREKERASAKGLLFTASIKDSFDNIPRRETPREAFRDGKPPGFRGKPEAQPRYRGKPTTGIVVKVMLRMSYVPTGLLHILSGDETPLVTFKVAYSGSKDWVRLKFTTYLEGYSAKAIDTLELKKGSEAEISQFPTFFPEKLKDINELTRGTRHVQVDDLDGAIEQHRTFAVPLLARNTAYLSVDDPSNGNKVDLSSWLAAWVTPNHKEVMTLLRESASFCSSGRMVGYQVDKDGVREQVQAVFNALKQRKVTYINSLVSFGAHPGEFLQRIRLPSEAIKIKSANCIDGVILMVSVLEAASLNPAIVLVPGHALLGWQPNRIEETWDFVETTMIGSDDFDKAVEAGGRVVERQKKVFKITNNPAHFRLLSVPLLRAKGITPME